MQKVRDIIKNDASTLFNTPITLNNEANEITKRQERNDLMLMNYSDLNPSGSTRTNNEFV